MRLRNIINGNKPVTKEMKLINLLMELKVKDRWVPLSAREIKDIQDELYNLIKTAYLKIGGHPNYNSPSDLPLEGDIFDVIDLDGDPDVDAVSVVKKKPAGSKLVALGHDNSAPAKSMVVNRQVQLLGKKGYYVEASGKIQDILLSKGLKPVTDEKAVRKALAGKEFEWHGDGSYTRKIGGASHRKMLFGKPRV